MVHIKMERSTRLGLAIGISLSFFIAEIAMGFKTHSIALIADAFHYLNDLLSFVVALVALLISKSGRAHSSLTFGWQRATLLGAFFNGVFLLALGVSIFLQSIDRFINLEHMEDPFQVLIVGCVGLALNIVTITFLHEHDHGHDHHHGPGDVPLQLDVASQGEVEAGEAMEITEPYPDHGHHHEHRHRDQESPHSHSHRDFGMAGVLLHVLGDACNNIGVIIAATIIWKLKSEKRFYADPAISMFIAFMIFFTALPLVKKTGHILLQSPPSGVDVEDIRHDLEKIPGVSSVHELHVWRLNQQKSLASAHVVLENPSFESFQAQARIIKECFHAYGVHSATIQPEMRPTEAPRGTGVGGDGGMSGVTSARSSEDGWGASGAAATEGGGVEGASYSVPRGCQVACGTGCEKMTCCG